MIKGKKQVGILALAAMLLMLGGCGKEQESSLQTGMQALTTQNYPLAIESFEQAIEMGEDMEAAYRGIGLAYMGQGNYEKAVTAFRTALSNAGMFPGDLEYDINYYLAIAYYKLGEYELATQVYDSIIALEPKAVEAYYLRGSMKLYLLEDGQSTLEEALADFDETVALNKNDYDRYIDIYEVLVSHNQMEAAQTYLEQVMRVDSSKISNYNKARLAYYEGAYEQACNYLNLARQKGEADAEMIAFLGDCYQAQGEYILACSVYSGYVEENPDPEMYNKMGMCYVQEGDYANALASFQAGQRITENNTCMQTLKLNEIACYEYLYDFKTARDLLGAYLQQYPATSDLQREYAFLLTR